MSDTKGTTPAPSSATPDVLRLARPDGITDEAWAEIRRNTDRMWASLTGQANTCKEYSWCVIAADDPEHANCHSSAPVKLPPDGKWWAWLAQDVPTDGAVQIVMEESRGVHCVSLDADELAKILEATAGTARIELEKLIEAAGFGNVVYTDDSD